MWVIFSLKTNIFENNYTVFHFFFLIFGNFVKDPSTITTTLNCKNLAKKSDNSKEKRCSCVAAEICNNTR